jgi:NTE family protein
MSTLVTTRKIHWDKQPHPNSIGLALGGGAARGIAHIGVLQVLEENAIYPTYVVGTSIGALIGGMYAAGISASRMAQFAATMRWRSLLSVNIPTLNLSLQNLSFAGGTLPFLEGATGFFELDKLADWFESVVGGEIDFAQLNIPFAAIATELTTGDTLALNTGRVATAIRASCSVPGIFTPTIRQGRILVDGGISHNLPAAAVRAMGSDYAIAVNILPAGGATVFSRPGDMDYKPHHIVDVAMYSIYSLIRMTQVDETPADCVITPAIGHISFTDLGRFEEMIAAGRAAATAAMPQLLHDLGRA